MRYGCFVLHSLFSHNCVQEFVFLPILTRGKPEVAEYQPKKKAGFKVITLKIIQPLQILQFNLACITAGLEGSKNWHVSSNLCLPYNFCCVSERYECQTCLLLVILSLLTQNLLSFLAFPVKTVECLLFYWEVRISK